MKIKPIILCAGVSSRFGGNKLLYEVNKKPMYQNVVGLVLELSSVLDKPVIVTQYKEIVGFAKKNNLDCVINENPLEGISSSIKLGVNFEDADYYMFFTADQPYLKKETIENFVMAFKLQDKPLGCLKHGEKSGNPTIFKNTYKSNLLRLDGDKGGKKIINKNIQNTFFFEASEKELTDIDTLS